MLLVPTLIVRLLTIAWGDTLSLPPSTVVAPA